MKPSLAERIVGAVKPTACEHHSKWLTVRELARKFRCSHAKILEAVDESDSLDLMVGVRVGSLVGTIDNEGDYRVEFVGDDA